MVLSRVIIFFGVILFLGCCGINAENQSYGNEDCPQGDSFAEDYDNNDDHDDEDSAHEHGENHEMNGDHGDGHDHDHDDDHDDHEECATTSYAFDGVWYYETMQKSPELKDFTLAAIVSTDENGVVSGPIFNIHSSDSFTVSGGIYNETGYLKIAFGDQQRTIMTSFSANTKYHIAIVVNSMSNSVSVIIDGKLLKQVSFSSITGLPADGRITIGYAVGKDYAPYQGNIQNLMLWNRILTDAEIEDIHDHNHCNHDPTLVLDEHNMVPQKYDVPTVDCGNVQYTFNNTGDQVEYYELNFTIPRLEFATICVRITTNAKGSIPGTPGSYGTKDEPEGISVTGFINSKGEAKNAFVIEGQKFILPGQFMPNTEYSMCVLYHYKHSHLMSYINNQPVTIIQYNGMGYMPGGGKAIFGQRQQKLGGCFDYPYMGTMGDPMYWGRILSVEEIRGYTAGRCPTDKIF